MPYYKVLGTLFATGLIQVLMKKKKRKKKIRCGKLFQEVSCSLGFRDRLLWSLGNLNVWFL